MASLASRSLASEASAVMAAGLPIHTMVQLGLFMQHHGFAVWDLLLQLQSFRSSSLPLSRRGCPRRSRMLPV